MHSADHNYGSYSTTPFGGIARITHLSRCFDLDRHHTSILCTATPAAYFCCSICHLQPTSFLIHIHVDTPGTANKPWRAYWYFAVLPRALCLTRATMPFVDADVHAHLARKRRWQGDPDDDIHGIYGSEQPGDIFFLNHEHATARARKIVPLSKRPRILNTDGGGQDTQPSRRRKASLSPPQHDADDRSGAKPLLTPCHVCHRKPTKKSHLDSFADCQGCGERTCFVCIRQCHGRATMVGEEEDENSPLLEQEMLLSRSFQMEDFADDTTTTPLVTKDPHLPPTPASEMEHEHGQKGWHARGHRSVICSRCCIERGVEGDVVCLGCLSSMEGV